MSLAILLFKQLFKIFLYFFMFLIVIFSEKYSLVVVKIVARVEKVEKKE